MAKGTSARPGIPAWKNVSDSAKGTVYGLASAARSTVAGAARSPGRILFRSGYVGPRVRRGEVGQVWHRDRG